jgi:hypothetical protein
MLVQIVNFILVSLFVLSSIAIILLIDVPREPITKDRAVVIVIVQLAIAVWLFIHLK